MTGEKFTFFSDLPSQLKAIPEDSTVSKTLFSDGDLKAVLFGMDAGQELSEHSVKRPALLYFLSGEIDFFVDDKHIAVQPGSWMHLTAGCTHSVVAKTPTTFLLVLLKNGAT